MLGLLPGVANTSGIIPGDGCLHREVDTQQLATTLRAHQGPRVWLSYVPPLQRPGQPGQPGNARSKSSVVTDLSEGVHLGSPHIANAIVQSGAILAVHGQLASLSPLQSTGTLRFSAKPLATPPPIIAVQPLEALPQRLGGARPITAAVILSVHGSTISWRRLKR